MKNKGKNTVKITRKEYWVDSVFNSLSENEKVGQLFNVRVFSDKDAAYEKTIIELLNKYHIGGVTFFKGSPYKQVVITNTLQGKSKVPLMIAMDAEIRAPDRIAGSAPGKMILRTMDHQESPKDWPMRTSERSTLSTPP